jgi:hypothetical protein
MILKLKVLKYMRSEINNDMYKIIFVTWLIEISEISNWFEAV